MKKQNIFISMLALTIGMTSHQVQAANSKDAQPEKNIAQPAAIGLGTETGIEVGGQLSSYRYQEHVVADTEFMHESGTKFGVTATGTKVFDNGMFVTADGRFSYGSNDYSGSGTQRGIPEYLWDIRMLGGKDFIFDNVSGLGKSFSVAPYLGLGFRDLFNDWSGTTSTGSRGYQRNSEYFYLPLGVTPRFRVTDDARISTNLEYDQLLVGQETSELSQVNSALPNVTNRQSGGYGLRGSVMYEEAKWSVGPFFDYWNIDQSDISMPLGVYEPHNQTVEYGVQARYRF